MLKNITATRLIKKMGNGRTLPILIECEDDQANLVEVVTKFSNGCMEKEKNLIAEAIVAMLGADLGLPIPEPFIVESSVDFTSSLQDAQIKQHITMSNKFAFGSRNLPSGFAVWSNGQTIPKELTTEAAEIFVFDAIIANSDRRPVNPNCLFTGKELAIFDHELTLSTKHILFWKAPWIEGGFENISEKDNHIFSYSYFEERPLNLDRFIQAWKNISAERFEQYKKAIPPEWGCENFLDTSISYLKEAQGKIDEIATNAMKTLS